MCDLFLIWHKIYYKYIITNFQYDLFLSIYIIIYNT